MLKLKQTVALSDVKIFAPIGYYPEEQILGNHFLVSIKVEFEAPMGDREELNRTINYERLYEIITTVMLPKRKLLESAVEEMLIQVYEGFDFVDFIEVGILKLNPAFGGDLANSEVKLTYVR
ncbi:dihydroneopterin aldolase [Sphingobacteriaceae bacterium WQ 2009]|uniref:Dihydroneopterin aldolase n=1 Tax=Rhinopithecimicrobium faecis TaxID=2820698 RepID=A0A8T4HD72_9SPHI|nr:dihydroneopterin aldolase [Sphingobacteriaceae bacterium WQ 2009]